MVFRLRKLNDFASGFGVLALLIPFVISTVLTFTAFSLGDENALGSISLYTPENYDNMNRVEREAWMHNNHGGVSVREWRTELTWKINFFGQWWYVWPDGFELTEDQYERFLSGNGDQTDYVEIAKAVLFLNPPLLSAIGVAGVLIRIILIVCVAVGLVELLWIG